MINKNSLYGRSVIAEQDFSAEQLNYMINFAIKLKDQKAKGILPPYLKHKNIAGIFMKPSTRTRSAFEIASADTGANFVYLDAQGSHIGSAESIVDTAKVLGEMYDGIEFRGYKQQDVENLAKYSGVPVWNGLTDENHPTQMLADYMTVKENFGHIKGINLTYLGDGSDNVATSLLVTGAILGVNVHIVSPKAYQPAKRFVTLANKLAKKSGAKLMITDDVAKGVRNSNVIYTDVWLSMGVPESEFKKRIKTMMPYQVNMKIMKATGNADNGKLIFMHCLPSFHDNSTTIAQHIYKKFDFKPYEVTDDVFNNPKYARQFEEAQNRMHSIKAMMIATLNPIKF
ncbi:ornithine carbamoyltransferase [uncultured bacterium]|uniref:ornithine carbamoyltransferase n=1 Tax=Acetilactobacillus jinshanensis TaxID=1720083 RepID=UPI0021848917|nr:ornithine carbamoyltransferase [uncultured bacterium]